MVKNLTAMHVSRFSAWVGKIPWRKEWLSTPIFLPGESHGQRSLVGYSPWDHKESDMTEQLTFHTHFSYSQRESRQTVKSCCPHFLWQANYEGHTSEGVEHSLGKEGLGSDSPWFFIPAPSSCGEEGFLSPVSFGHKCHSIC